MSRLINKGTGNGLQQYAGEIAPLDQDGTYGVLHLEFHNIGLQGGSITFWTHEGVNPTDEDRRSCAPIVEANATVELTCMPVYPGEKITVQASDGIIWRVNFIDNDD
jgi:hypothetical protein